MQQIKIFKGVENDTAALERDVNAWLKTSKPKVLNIFGNIAPQTAQGSSASHMLGAERSGGKSFVASDVLIVVLHETA